MLTSLKQLLSRIVDYAGIFPPAQLSLPEAINIYDRACSSLNRWMLDRFVLPATHLQEFTKLLLSEDITSSQPWALSVIVSKNWRSKIDQIHQIIEQSNLSTRIRSLEVTSLSPVEVEQISLDLPAEIDTFFEIPFNVDLESYLSILQRIGAGAKLRTGGVTSDAFPDSTQLGQRILSLANARIPFKATAGLHHPLRGHCFTHPSNTASTTMHGFLNVAIASAFAYQQVMTLNQIVEILEETSIEAFQLSDTEIRWHEHSLSITAIEASRQHFFHSFGSCSFEEPIHDLYNLKLL